MKRLFSIFMVASAILVTAAYLTPASQASAVSSASLSIVPKKNYTIEAGKSVNDTLTIRNLDAEAPLELNLRVVDFTFTDDGGTPKLFLAEDAPQTTWSLKPFLKVPQTVTVAPKSSKTVDINVAVPKNGGAGSYYSAIVYSSGSGDGGNVGLSASGVTLVFASIPGIVNENLVLENFGAYREAQAEKEAGYVFMTATEPQTIAYTLKNNGNVTESPVGSITLTDMFGKERVINDVNPNGSLALIGQTRTYTACIQLASEEVNFNGTRAEATQCKPAGLWPGYYSASLNLFYGQNGNRTQEIVSNASFWYLPWWFVITFTIVLALVVYFARKGVNTIRRMMYGPTMKKASSTKRRK